MSEPLGGAAKEPRAQTMGDVINDRIGNCTRELRASRDRLSDVADTIIGPSPTPPESGGPQTGNLTSVPNCTTTFLDELERVTAQVLHQISRLRA